MKKTWLVFTLLITLLASVLPLTASAQSVAWKGNQSYYPLGTNYAWYDYGNDFSNASFNANWNTIKTQIDDMAAKGVKTVRWWVFAGMMSAPNFSGSGLGSTVTGLPDGWVQNMVTATDYLHSKGMKAYYCFVAHDMDMAWNQWSNHEDIVSNTTVQNSYFNNAIKPIVQALGNHDGIMGWDIINEPEWMVRDEDGGGAGNTQAQPQARTAFTLGQLRTFIKNNVDFIRPYVTQPISVGSASAKWVGKEYNFYSGLGLDFYDFHWYDWYTPYFDPTVTPASSLGLDKPVIIGEIFANPAAQYTGTTTPKNHYSIGEKIYLNGYAGYLVWTWNDQNSVQVAKDHVAPHLNNLMNQYAEMGRVTSNSISYEAEHATVSGSYTLHPNEAGYEAYSARGCVSLWNAPNTAVRYGVNATSTRNHSLQVHYANGDSTAKVMDLYVNNTKVNTLTFNATGSWGTVGSVNVTVGLQAGANTIELKRSGTHSLNFNMDKIVLQ
ncbi:carbohydrate-binding protein [Paenibacillus swuensis]|uniref:carbohydrate-binding protein n=1 Tax=Paenibacillus swuensis TaxID=1178515 RepID=UPI0008398789|nr:carbohydrate-binding protein [Paenibacillus swuensis]